MSLLVPLVGLSSSSSSCQQHHPTGLCWASSPEGRAVKKDLSPPSFLTALGDGAHTGFFPYFTSKHKKFWRPWRWRPSLLFMRRHCGRALGILSAFSYVLMRLIPFPPKGHYFLPFEVFLNYMDLLLLVPSSTADPLIILFAT